MTKQLKLTQVVGKKLDPNAKYMFMFNGSTTPYNQIEHFRNEMTRLLGANNFAITLLNGDPKKEMSIMEIVSDRPSTVRENYVYKDMPESIARSLKPRDEDCVDCEEKRRAQAEQAPTTYFAVPPEEQPNAELSENEA